MCRNLSWNSGIKSSFCFHFCSLWEVIRLISLLHRKKMFWVEPRRVFVCIKKLSNREAAFFKDHRAVFLRSVNWVLWESTTVFLINSSFQKRYMWKSMWWTKDKYWMGMEDNGIACGLWIIKLHYWVGGNKDHAIACAVGLLFWLWFLFQLARLRWTIVQNLNMASQKCLLSFLLVSVPLCLWKFSLFKHVGIKLCLHNFSRAVNS